MTKFIHLEIDKRSFEISYQRYTYGEHVRYGDHVQYRGQGVGSNDLNKIQGEIEK
mgnify:CR=1 FL=1